ncbi:MAG: hypothetical protein ABJM58_12690 [Alteripontixanthobacter sp.]
MRALIAFAGLAALTACNSEAEPPPAVQSPQAAFWEALSSHCGQAYSGALVSDDEADADMRGADMAMHVRGCTDSEIRVPFHIQGDDGEWNRSRTWVFTRTGSDGEGGLRLQHDHRHEDGTSDAVTMYGGDTAAPGSARAQEFPVDGESIALFEREGLDVSVTNVWRVEVDPADTANAQFAYQLRRTVAGGAPEPRNFRVEFDLTQPVEPPPPPWGSE